MVSRKKLQSILGDLHQQQKNLTEDNLYLTKKNQELEEQMAKYQSGQNPSQNGIQVMLAEKIKELTHEHNKKLQALELENQQLLKNQGDLEDKIKNEKQEHVQLREKYEELREEREEDKAKKASFIHLRFFQNTSNINIYESALRMGWNGKDKVTICVDIEKDVIVCSSSATKPALVTGEPFPSGTIIKLINKGNILGRGGTGGVKGPGGDGGDAIHLSYPISLVNLGTIAAGGGGGAGYVQYANYGGGGGASYGEASYFGCKGTITKGGAGASGQSMGGDWAKPGASWGGASGGKPGSAIVRFGHKLDFQSKNIIGEILD